MKAIKLFANFACNVFNEAISRSIVCPELLSHILLIVPSNALVTQLLPLARTKYKQMSLCGMLAITSILCMYCVRLEPVWEA